MQKAKLRHAVKDTKPVDIKLTLSYVKIKCGTKRARLYDFKDIDVSAISEDCELCGSHGSVEISFRCKDCGKYHTMKIKEW